MNIEEMSIRARVRMGACELDIVRPGWYKAIDPDSLDLKSSCNCVLAQLDDGDYSVGCQQVFGVQGMVGTLGVELVEASGFVTNAVDAHYNLQPGEYAEDYDEEENDTVGDTGAYNAMTRFWKQEIRARKRAEEAVEEFKKLAIKVQADQ